jgi:hypothetical protein
LAEPDAVAETLSALASRLEAIAARIRMLGLLRAAEDLGKVSAELRRLCDPERDGAQRDRT